jgi:uncharacterized membrane protein
VELIDTELLNMLLTSAHPAIVHFPIALLLTATLFDAGCLVLRSQLWLDRAAVALMMLGGLSLGAAYLSGQRAAEAAAPVTGAAQGILADHEDLALLSLTLWSAAIVLRLFVSWLGRHDLEVQLGIFRLAALVLAFAGVFLVVATALHGGQLVHVYGVGVGS